MGRVQRPTYTIVGLARDTKYNDLRQPFAPEFYAPAVQDPQYPLGSLKLVIRSSPPLEKMTAAIAALAREENPAIVGDFRTMASQLHDAVLRERLMASLSGFFGGLAALIAAIGLYGVMSYTVARRRNEIGVRIALGADRRQVMRMVMGEAGGLLATGLAIGVPAALAVTGFASALLFGVTPRDPATLGAAVVGLALVAALASYVPALRASSRSKRFATSRGPSVWLIRSQSTVKRAMTFRPVARLATPAPRSRKLCAGLNFRAGSGSGIHSWIV
jgi:putative ABC transport system permease protein